MPGSEPPAEIIQFRVVPLEDNEARVAIFFPAVKERSGLRFHIHSAFASTVARDSVRDAPENIELVTSIGRLIADQLPRLLTMDLVDDGLLAALPNPNDNLHARYAPIRELIIDAFHEAPLTPVHGGRDRALAQDLLSSPSSFRRALTAMDLDVLATIGLGSRETPYRWVADRPGRSGQFLQDLRVGKFEWGDLAEVVTLVSDEWSQYDDPKPVTSKQAHDDLRAWLVWLETKNDKQLRRLYAFLGEGYQEQAWRFDLTSIPIVRLIQSHKSRHVAGSTTYLPATRRDKAAKRVPIALAVFPDDPADKEHGWLRSFYEAAGVKTWNDTTRVLERLDVYRSGEWPDRDQNVRDVRLFQEFVAADPSQASRFKDKKFLIGVNALAATFWVAPSQLFLDEPYAPTDLNMVYLAELVVTPSKYRLWPGYDETIDGLADFARLVGCTDCLTITMSPAWSNSQFSWTWASGRETRQGTKRDWDLIDFDKIVDSRSEVLLRSLWETVCTAPRDRSKAVYQHNGSSELHRMPSTIAQKLESTAWILDLDGNLRTPATMTEEELAAGLELPTGNSLIHEVGFASEATANAFERSVREQAAVDAGLPSGEYLDRIAALFVGKSPEAQSALLARFELLDEDWEVDGATSDDPGRRTDTAQALALGAPNRTYEVRERSVAVESGPQTSEAKAYLRGHYTRRDGRLACQACHLPMPFRVGDLDYFEAVHFIRGAHKVHHQNRLALCPLCAAKYKHAKGTEDADLKKGISELLDETENEAVEWVDLPVDLAGATHDLRFAVKHALELKGVLASDGDLPV